MKEIIDNDEIKPNTNGKVNSKKNKPCSEETIRANTGFLKIKGKSLLKALMEEKKKEREK